MVAEERFYLEQKAESHEKDVMFVVHFTADGCDSLNIVANAKHN